MAYDRCIYHNQSFVITHQVITLTEAGSVIRVNLSNMHMITISESHTGGCTAVAFNPLSSERIATVSIEDKTIR